MGTLVRSIAVVAFAADVELASGAAVAAVAAVVDRRIQSWRLDT